MTEGPSQEGDEALREALRTTWKTSEEEIESLVPQPKEGHSTIRKMHAALLIVVKTLLPESSSASLHLIHYLSTHSFTRISSGVIRRGSWFNRLEVEICLKTNGMLFLWHDVQNNSLTKYMYSIKKESHLRYHSVLMLKSPRAQDLSTISVMSLKCQLWLGQHIAMTIVGLNHSLGHSPTHGLGLAW